MYMYGLESLQWGLPSIFRARLLLRQMWEKFSHLETSAAHRPPPPSSSVADTSNIFSIHPLFTFSNLLFSQLCLTMTASDKMQTGKVALDEQTCAADIN